MCLTPDHVRIDFALSVLQKIQMHMTSWLPSANPCAPGMQHMRKSCMTETDI